MARPIREVPWLAKRGGKFYVHWYDAAARETKRLSLRTGDSKTAQDRFSAWLAEGQWVSEPGRDARLSVSAALDSYWSEHVAMKCAAPERQETIIGHLKAHFGHMPIEDVDVPKSHVYAQIRRAANMANGTIRRELAVLVAASNHAKKWGRIKSVPSVDLPPERLLGQDEEAPFYSRSEINTLLMVAEGELHHFITLAYYTGARRASIEDLTRPQVRWSQGQIVLQKEGKKATKKRQPIVPILPEIEPSLKALWSASEGRQRLFERNDFYLPFRGLCEDLGMPERSHPHLLRHTRATHLLQGGVALWDVAALLGDTVATVARVYGHHSQDKLVEALRGK